MTSLIFNSSCSLSPELLDEEVLVLLREVVETLVSVVTLVEEALVEGT